MKWSKFNLFFKSKSYGYLLYNSLSNSFIDIPDEDVKFIKRLKILKKIDINSEALQNNINALIDKKIIVDDDNIEILNIKLKRHKQRFDESVLHLTINPTLNCNFACKYCFEGEKKKGNMSSKTIGNLMTFIKSFKTSKIIAITWFGGEPLMNPKSMEKLTNLIKKESSLELHASMVTNGYLLTDEIINKLEEWNIRSIQITIDGMPPMHNQRRPLKNGAETFDVIFNNIDKTLKLTSKVFVSIRVNLDKNNLDEFIDVIRYVMNRYKEYPNRINVYPGFVQEINSCSFISECTLNTEKRRDFILDMWHKYNMEILPFFPMSDVNECGIRNVNSFTIGPDGEIYKCWNDVGVKDKIISNLNTKKIINDTLLLRYLTDADPLESHECMECFFLPICSGGCPYVRIQNQDKGIKSDEYCLFTKDHFNEFLEYHYTYLKHIEEYNKKNNNTKKQ